MCIIQSLHHLKVAGWTLHKRLPGSFFVLLNHEIILSNCLKKMGNWVFEMRIMIRYLNNILGEKKLQYM